MVQKVKTLHLLKISAGGVNGCIVAKPFALSRGCTVNTIG